MPWIRTVDEKDAGDELAGVYAGLVRQRGKLSRIMQVQSLRPDAMRAHMELYRATMFGSGGPSREEREMIAVVVSAANRCDYCVRHHGEGLKAYWRDEERLKRFIADYRTLAGAPRMSAVLAYADQLTRSPGSMTEAHVVALR